MADSKTLRVVFYADSDAINRFEKFHRLEVLFPPRRLRIILSISQHRLCIEPFDLPEIQKNIANVITFFKENIIWTSFEKTIYIKQFKSLMKFNEI